MPCCGVLFSTVFSIAGPIPCGLLGLASGHDALSGENAFAYKYGGSISFGQVKVNSRTEADHAAAFAARQTVPGLGPADDAPGDESGDLHHDPACPVVLAQAQRAVATNSIDRFTQNLGVLVGIKPDLADKFDADYWADAYADLLGVDPQLVVPGKTVALIREQRAQAQAQANQVAMAREMAGVAKDLGAAQAAVPTSPMSPLEGGLQSSSPDQIMGQFAGW